MEEVHINVSFARDLWNIIHKAKHPHFESEIVESIKNQLANKIQEAILSARPKEEIKQEPVEDNSNAV